MKENQSSKSKIKLYYTALFSLIILLYLFWKCNHQKDLKIKEQKEYEQRQIFGKIISGRSLESEEEFLNDMKRICGKASKSLRKFYSTGDNSVINLSDIKEKGKKQKTPVESLLNILDIDNKNINFEDEAKNYLVTLLPGLIFLCFGILTIPGWITCCCFSCFNCCCCGCCKKEKCIKPWIIVVISLSSVTIILSIYGLAKSNSIFTGFSNAECSFLQFIDQVMNGQKKAPPFWVGIDRLKERMKKLNQRISELEAETIADLNSKKGVSLDKSDNFLIYLNKLVDYFQQKKTSTSPPYKNTFNGVDYVIDVVEKFGVDTSDEEQANTFLNLISQEYKLLTESADEQFQEASDNLELILGNDGFPAIIDAAIESLDEISSPVKDIKEEITDGVVKIADLIDLYGKIIFKLIFSLLFISNAAVIALMVLFVLLSKNFGCGRYLIKIFLHVLWNLSALFLIFVFIFGSLFITVGNFGRDLTLAIFYIISDKNLLSSRPIFLGDAAKYFRECVQGEGKFQNLIEGFNEDNAGIAIDILTWILEELTEIGSNLDNIKGETITEYKKLVNERVHYQNLEICEIGKYGQSSSCLKSSSIIKNLGDSNSLIWRESCSGVTTKPGQTCCEPQNCISQLPDNDYGNIYKAMIENANLLTGTGGTSDSTTINIVYKNSTNVSYKKNVKEVYDDLDFYYLDLIQSYKDTTFAYQNPISILIDSFQESMGSGHFFDLFNCLFIGDNLYLILKYLKDTFGNEIYNAGIVLVIVGFIIIFSISTTILSIILINFSVIEKIKGLQTQTNMDQNQAINLNQQNNKVQPYESVPVNNVPLQPQSQSGNQLLSQEVIEDNRIQTDENLKNPPDNQNNQDLINKPQIQIQSQTEEKNINQNQEQTAQNLQDNVNNEIVSERKTILTDNNK